MRAAVLLVAIVCGACALFRVPDRAQEIAAARADLARAGFPFDADVRFTPAALAVCDGMACADVVMVENRRTIRLADGAFQSPSKLRATLLEIWPRYQLQRRGDLEDLARSALLVARDGGRAGVTDPEVIADARFFYRRLYERLEPERRTGLPSPDALAGR